MCRGKKSFAAAQNGAVYIDEKSFALIRRSLLDCAAPRHAARGGVALISSTRRKVRRCFADKVSGSKSSATPCRRDHRGDALRIASMPNAAAQKSRQRIADAVIKVTLSVLLCRYNQFGDAESGKVSFVASTKARSCAVNSAIFASFSAAPANFAASQSASQVCSCSECA